MASEIRIVKTYLSRKPDHASVMVSLGLIVLMTLFSEVYWWDFGGMGEWLTLTKEDILVHQYWRLFTATLIHADFKHYLANVYMLFILGLFVYGYFGFWFFPLLGLLSSAITNYFSILSYSSEVHLLGSSGLVYWLSGFWLILYLFIDRSRRILSRILRVVGVGLVILFPSSFEQQVSYRTHAIGFGLGILCGTIYFMVNFRRLRGYEEKVLDAPLDAPNY